MKSKIHQAAVSVLLLMATAICVAQGAENKEAEFAEHIQKAQNQLRAKRPDLAIPELEAAAALNPDSVETQANLGVLLYFQGKLAAALPHLRAALDKNSDLPNIRGLLGIAELHILDFTDGRKDLEASFPLIKEPKFKVEVGLELAGFYTQIGSLEEAASILADLRKTAPDNAEVLYASYRTYSDLSSEAMMGLALNAPASAQMHKLMAHEQIKKGNTNEAIAQFRKAISINPKLPGVHFELAELLNTSHDPIVEADAEQEYRAALLANPIDEKAECRLADIDVTKGNTAKAFEEYSKAAELEPTDADAKLGLAKILIEMNQLDKALPLLEEAVRLEPTNPSAHYRLATLLRKQGREADAKREVNLYKQYKDLKEKLRQTYKDLLVAPKEIREGDPVEK